jgi:hypothetical protein
MTDLQETAAKYRREAKRDYGRSRREAQRAAYWYKSARETEKTARWLSRRPDMWEEDFTSATVEARAHCWRHVADTFLRGSFRAMESARFHNDLAARYDEMSAQYARDSI